MLKFTFTPPDFSALRAMIEKWGHDLVAVLQEAVEESCGVGLEEMIRIVETETTPTGERRAADEGGHPGRIESGQMIADLKAEIAKTTDGAIGEFGWIDRVLEYYEYQNDGTGAIRAMEALQKAYIQAREELLKKLTVTGLGF